MQLTALLSRLKDQGVSIQLKNHLANGRCLLTIAEIVPYPEGYPIKQKFGAWHVLDVASMNCDVSQEEVDCILRKFPHVKLTF